MVNSVDPDQTAPIGAVCSGSTLFAPVLNSSECQSILCSRRLQQTTFSDAFFLGALGVNWIILSFSGMTPNGGFILIPNLNIGSFTASV